MFPRLILSFLDDLRHKLSSDLPNAGMCEFAPTCRPHNQLPAMHTAATADVHRPAISLFYLILRGLDTVEDDMTIPTEKKNVVLRNFYKHITQPGWTFDGNGPDEKDRQLLVEFDCVCNWYFLFLCINACASVLQRALCTCQRWDALFSFYLPSTRCAVDRLLKSTWVSSPGTKK